MYDLLCDLLLRNIRVHVDVLPDQHLVADCLGAAAEPAPSWHILLLLVVVANLVLYTCVYVYIYIYIYIHTYIYIYTYIQWDEKTFPSFVL